MCLENDDFAAGPAVYLLPALGTDERLFNSLRTAYPEIVTPPWIAPQRRESLASYAERLAATLPRDRPCYVGGVSFGGMVALELTRHLPARGCLLISSIRSARELPPLLRRLRFGAWLLPPGVDRIIAGGAGLLHRVFGPICSPSWSRLLVHLSKLREPLVPWALRAISGWEPEPDWPCRVHHIQGEFDVLLPARCTRPDVVIPGGFHLLSQSHPLELIECLRPILRPDGEIIGDVRIDSRQRMDNPAQSP